MPIWNEGMSGYFSHNMMWPLQISTVHTSWMQRIWKCCSTTGCVLQTLEDFGQQKRFPREVVAVLPDMEDALVQPIILQLHEYTINRIVWTGPAAEP